ncbi:MAG: hypothetical protein QXQ70_03065 [Candidatus Caldarchaeum sp.]
MKEIKLQGSIINIYAPAPLYRHSVDVSMLKWSGNLRNFINDLKELVRQMDEHYAERAIRGRNLQVNVKPVKVSGDREELRTLDVPIVPSRVENILASVRKELYDGINSICPFVEKIDLGRKKRRIYFLPNSRVNDFLELVDACNRRVSEANNIIKDYVASQYFKTLNTILTQYGFEQVQTIATVPKIRYSLLPVVLDPGIIIEYVDEKYRKDVERSILVEKKEILRSALEKIRQEIDAIVNIQIQPDKSLTTVTQKIAALENLAKDIGVADYLKQEIDRLRSMAAGYGEGDEVYRKNLLQKIQQISNQRLKTLLKEMAEP